jgi:hypothetical protein
MDLSSSFIALYPNLFSGAARAAIFFEGVRGTLSLFHNNGG